jgi:hypothetical protein
MCLGLLASIIGCLKFINFNQIITTTDPTYVMVIWKMGSLAEAKIGMIEANMPPLKAWGEDILGKVRSSKFMSMNSSGSGTILSQHSGSRTESTWKCGPEEKRNESKQGLIIEVKKSPQLAAEEV